MNYVFGPVPTRRLGQSLGIDPVPLKTCNWNCVYCQLGRSKPMVNERKNYFSPKEILAEVEMTLTSHKTGEIDWITFVGSGETTLHSSIGWLIKEVKALTKLPVAIITNGSLLYMPEVRSEISSADAVLPSLDAGNAQLYRKINRALPSLSFTRLLEGLTQFRKEYSGNLWVEVMLVQGLNDTAKALKEIAMVLKGIQPDEIHIVQPTRPPGEPWVQPPDEEGLLRATALLGPKSRIIHPAVGNFDLSGGNTLVEAIIAIITRHPIREKELVETLNRWSLKDVEIILSDLEESGKAQIVERYGVKFWSASPAHYPKERLNQEE